MTPLVFAGLVFAVFSAAILITEDDVFSGVRRNARSRLKTEVELPDDNRTVIYLERTDLPVIRLSLRSRTPIRVDLNRVASKAEKLITCPRCTGMWLSFAAVAAWSAHAGNASLVMILGWGLAVSGGQFFADQISRS